MQFSKQIVLWIGGEFFEVGLEKIRKTNQKTKALSCFMYG